METFKAYVVKQNPLAVEYIEVKETAVQGMVIENFGRHKPYFEGMWFRDRESAVRKADKIRQKQIDLLNQRISKLQKVKL